jgi:hypothetical protein
VFFTVKIAWVCPVIEFFIAPMPQKFTGVTGGEVYEEEEWNCCPAA